MIAHPVRKKLFLENNIAFRTETEKRDRKTSKLLERRF